MRCRLAAVFVVAAASLIVATPAIGGTAPGCAATGGPHAALVVDTGSRSTAYCVALDAPSVSGIHLIQLAAAQRGLSYGLGFGGQAVCRLQGVGPAGDDCFASYPRYWGYWHGNGSGGWAWASAGASASTIHDGDVDGWVWGTGDSGTTHPSPPRIAIASICTVSLPTDPTAASPAVRSSPPATRPAAGTPRPTRPPSASPPAHTSSSSRPPVRIVAGAAPGPPPSGGMPPGVPLAAAMALVLGAAGLLRTRSRRRTDP
ncbi:MAG TPA: hypothetical protein VK646_06405 [Actinomycetota bacterium]|nr:hypothetical protein [Actinomycetota bacterium]